MGKSGPFDTRSRANPAQDWARRVREWAPGLIGPRLSRALRAEVPQKPAEAAAAATGRPLGTVRKWLSGETLPDGAAMLALVLCNGPDFLAALAAEDTPAWVHEALRADKLAELEAEQQRIAAEIAAIKGARR